MNILKSIFKRKLTTTFFVVAYTLAILSFSIGNSVIEQQKQMTEYSNQENNKMLSFEKCGSLSVMDLEKLLYDENITLDVSKKIDLNKSENFNICTSLINKGLKPFIPMKSGSYFSSKDFEATSDIAVFSSTMPVINNEYSFKVFTSNGASKKVTLKEKGISNEREQRVTVPKSIFFDCIDNYTLADNNLVIKINGEKADINKAINKIKSTIKEYNSDAKLNISPYIGEDNSAEYQYLFKASLIIIVIILLNSINISALWLEKRKNEIILRKIVGATNRDIFNILFSELTIISIISLVIAIGVQAILYKFANGSIFNANMALYKTNFIYAFILSIVTAYLSALPVYIYLLKIQPAQILLEE
jgi:putative ABC transport system permease protein